MPKRSIDLTATDARRLFFYNPFDGLVHWAVSKGPVKIGSVAGSVTRRGHIKVTINNRAYLLHRVIWLWMTGEWPPNEIDHRYGIQHDNRWSEIREATRIENARNCPTRSDNTSGFKGVHWHKWPNQGGKWQARIWSGGKRLSLGYFHSADLAHAAYCKANAELHGEFGRTA